MKTIMPLFLIFFMINTSCVAKTYIDIPYIQSGDEKQKLDIYTPSQRTKDLLPVHIYVHGGGWTIGDKKNLSREGRHAAKVYTTQGVILVSVNYRLAPENKHPSHIKDVAAAVGWIFNNIQYYGGNNRNMVLSGHSAGAHLITLLGTNEKYLKRHGLQTNIFQAIFPVDSASYDLTMPSEGRLKRLIERWKTGAFSDNRAIRIDASPLHQISSKDTLSPFVFYDSGQRPENFINKNSTKMVQTLRKFGHQGENHILTKDLSHIDMNRQIFQRDSVIFQDILSHLKVDSN